MVQHRGAGVAAAPCPLARGGIEDADRRHRHQEATATGQRPRDIDPDRRAHMYNAGILLPYASKTCLDLDPPKHRHSTGRHLRLGAPRPAQPERRRHADATDTLAGDPRRTAACKPRICHGSTEDDGDGVDDPSDGAAAVAAALCFEFLWRRRMPSEVELDLLRNLPESAAPDQRG